MNQKKKILDIKHKTITIKSALTLTYHGLQFFYVSAPPLNCTTIWDLSDQYGRL